MSLSKYYKSSSSFKPEKILKNKEDSANGWQSTPQQKPSSFEHRQLSDEAKKTSPSATTDTADGKTAYDAEKNHIPGQEERHDDPNASQNTETATVDLDNFIEISEHEALVEQAYQKGIQEGLEKIDQDYQSAAKTLLSICRQLDETRNTIINNSYNELQEFALSIAERILRISVVEQDNTILATIEEALQKAVKSDEFTIYIHPEDFDIVTAKSKDLISMISGLNHLVINKDITVERGGARIESDNCIIDATISSQFETIRETVKNKL